MTVPDNDGCLWPLDEGCLADEWESDFDPATKLRATALASSTLRRLTGFRVGGCPVTIRPTNTYCANYYARSQAYVAGGWYGSAFTPLNWNGTWTNTAYATTAHHNPTVALRLEPPVWGITEVKVDGAIVDPTRYFVTVDFYLTALDPQTWPRTQNLDLPDTAADTFSVTYRNSAPVDGMGAAAAAKLAVQFARACSGKKCELPASVTQLTRQGVTMTITPGSFPNGLTGIKDIDSYIGLWNPAGKRQRIGVWSPP